MSVESLPQKSHSKTEEGLIALLPGAQVGIAFSF